MANALADSMTALGDPTRRAIFERLADGPSSVGALADALAAFMQAAERRDEEVS